MYDDIMSQSGGSPTKPSWAYFARLHNHEMEKAKALESHKAMRMEEAARAEARERAEANRRRLQKIREENSRIKRTTPRPNVTPYVSEPPKAPAASVGHGNDMLDRELTNLARISGNSYVHGGKVVYPSR